MIKFIVSKRSSDLTIQDEYQAVWMFSHDSLAFVAGMCAVSIPILSSLSVDTGMIYDVVVQGGDVSSYRVMNSVPSDNVDDFNCFDINSNMEMCNALFSLVGEKTAVWVRGGDVRYLSYSLYHTNDLAFFDGMNECASYWNRDFRDYIYREPLNSSGPITRIRNWTFQGPRLFEIEIVTRDVDEEEIDDENIQDPWHGMVEYFGMDPADADYFVLDPMNV